MEQSANRKICISKQALHRMPYYLNYLKKMRERGETVVSSTAIAAVLQLNEVQVRKDMAAISTSKGKPKSGFQVNELILNMEDFLGYNNVKDAVLVGAGSLGSALLSYRGFESCGINIVAAFDSDENVCGKTVGNCKIYSMDQLEHICRRLNVNMGIITVPADSAQEVCDKLISSGILAICNFAPVHLFTPDNILVQNENMAASLAMLSKNLEDKLKSADEVSQM